ILDAPRARPLRMRSNRHWIELREVEIPAPTLGWGLAPRIRPFHRRAGVGEVVGRTECRAMIFRFRGEPRAQPARICARLGLTHVQSPGRGKRDEINLPPPEPGRIPALTVSLPEQRVRDAMNLAPVPAVHVPQRFSVVAARFDEAQVVLI